MFPPQQRGHDVASTRLYDLPDARTGTASGIYYGSIAAVLGCTLLVVWGTTQWAAWRLGFHPDLGQPVFAIEPGLLPWAYLIAFLAALAGALAATWPPARRLVAPLLLHRPHHARHGAFIGDGNRTVTEASGARYQFLRMGCAGEKSEIAGADQFGVRGNTGNK